MTKSEINKTNPMLPELPQSPESRYELAVQTLRTALQFGIEASIEGMYALMEFMGNPQKKYPSIQIAGTNGKSSTARFTAAILKASGYSTGLYTSPELIEYPERMELNGRVISHEMFANVILDTYQSALEAIQNGVIASITEFEILTAAAFKLFADQGLDYAVLEVGLGGRWDATSVVQPQVAVVTGIGLDHIDILGDTLEAIAKEKAAIIKEGSLAILGPGTEETRQVFLDQCQKVGSSYKIIETPDVKDHFLYPGPGYQQINIAVARAAVEAALGRPVKRDTVQAALDGLVVPGRFEVIRQDPLLMIDATHNPQSACFLRDALIERYDPIPFKTLLLGILTDKDAGGIIEVLTPLFENLAVTRSSSLRAMSPEDLAALVKRIDGRNPVIYPDVTSALSDLSERGETTLATGSITLAGEVKASVEPLLHCN
ncbi:MAG: bifunctional folylpolyglutamate synthase/dihydrofolate synthase [Coriobacteriales bacterium]|jgi:dihydrofolate synthase/folylpolyglutamate synthase|nr:bifunctional folylpolyglutamate synthase/dihydrofolate synthase [Coriobacteriales bacterium]